MSHIKAYGSWGSSLTAKKVGKKSIRYGHMCADGENIYWLESRAKERGRCVLVKCDVNKKRQDVLPENISIGSKVHEYGSADYLVDDGVVYFANAKDQCVYRYDGELIQLTNKNKQGEARYADFVISANKQFLLCVRETHSDEEIVNELVSINLAKRQNDKGAKLGNNFTVTVIQSGFDFYTFPRLNQLGDRLCWTCWNQPDMPWDAAELWVADFHADGTIDAAHKIIGGTERLAGENVRKTSVYQPLWSEDHVLHFIYDASGWSNIYSCRDGVLNALTPIDREFGIPQWSLASSRYQVTSDNQVYAIYFQQGEEYLCHIDEMTGHIETFELPLSYFSEHLLLSKKHLFFRAAGPQVEEAVYSFDIETKELECLSQLVDFPLASDEISQAKAIEFLSADDRPCHAFYYKPINKQYTPLAKTLPPLIVMSHGGPTAMANNALNIAIQFWTNRGFAVIDVNYAGSTGFGTKYRNLLKGKWGIIEVEDCIAAANYLVTQNLVDASALLIRGGSAGGFTTLCALTFHNIFTAGMSRYGVADLESLVKDSYKFEARYLDSLVGAYPQQKSRYRQRSPIHFVEQLACPLLLLQGENDKIVPPKQTKMMVDALTEQKIPFAYRLYPNEGHGFRQEKTLIDALNSELYFYRKILNLEDDESFSKIEINFLPTKALQA